MTEGLKSNALFIQIPYTPTKSLRVALARPTSLYKGGKIPPACGKFAAQPLRSDCVGLQIKTSVRSCDKDRSCFERGKKIPDLPLIQTGGLL